MYIVLTDILTCSLCGPEAGLILLADQIVERRVLAGVLGCPVCQARFTIGDGLVDLRGDVVGQCIAAAATGGEPESEPDNEPEDRESAIRLAALLGLAEGGNYALIIGGTVRLAHEIADLVEGLEAIVVNPPDPRVPRGAGVSRLLVADRLPISSASLRAVALTAGMAEAWLMEAVRILLPGGRLVIEGAPTDVRARLPDLGLMIVAEDLEAIVAVRG